LDSPAAAIVMASSEGLGQACAAALAPEGADPVVNGRHEDTVKATQDEIHAATGAEVIPVVGDVGTQDARRRLLAACPEPDILATSNAGPPPGSIADWDDDAWMAGQEAKLIAPALMIRAVLPGMRARGFGRIVNMSPAMAKARIPMMGALEGGSQRPRCPVQGSLIGGGGRQRHDQQPGARALRHRTDARAGAAPALMPLLATARRWTSKR
jgi:NAD(P)-dependent dehydrogenase (short-subunit alcohol dehydrogenase family)